MCLGYTYMLYIIYYMQHALIKYNHALVAQIQHTDVRKP